jgi:two-component system, NtrC family, nitrogen regulation sensor histidine kinase NtrY
MKNSRYSYTVVIRVILIGLNCFLLALMYYKTSRPATTAFFFVVLAGQCIGLIRYHKRIVRDLGNFLVFLEENDTSLAFSKKRVEKSFAGLVEHLDKINRQVQYAHIERERQYQYLQAVVKQIDTGIIAFDGNGKIELLNSAARDLLGIHSIRNIQTLIKVYPELNGFVNRNNRSAIPPIKVKTAEHERILSVKFGALRFDNKTIRLVSLQNIRPELEAEELYAWRRLIRIQRHEIINSITPITTLTAAIKRNFRKGNVQRKLAEITHEHIEDALISVGVIEERSRGLIDFIERFKSLTDIPRLKPGTIHLQELFDRISVLFAGSLQRINASLKTEIKPQNLTLKGDEKLLEQVIINLLKNSLEAMNHENGNIAVKAARNMEGFVSIKVIDDGSGIEESLTESVFVPSFTTKENGSGIGLSISRQIVQLHQGTLTVHSVPNTETIFEILLPEQAL